MEKKVGNRRNMKWKIETRKIDDLVEYPRNPRILTKKQEKHLKRNLEKFGLIDKIVINKDNTVIGGHQRLRILHDLGEKEVECSVPPHQLSDGDVEELNISLNLHGDWDYDKIANEWDIDLLVMLGMDPKKFFEDPEPKVKKPKVTIEFDSKEMLEDAMFEIEQISHRYECKIKLKV